MKTSEIRDKILEKKTLYNQAVIRSDEACCKIKKSLEGITDDDVMRLLDKTGIDIRELKTLDLERLKSDLDYVNTYQNKIDTAVKALHAYLEEALNV